MSYEELDVFIEYDADTGCIPNLQLKIKLANETLVQKHHNPISKPLYRDVKEYVQKPLGLRWIQKSTSTHSSPVDKSLCPSVNFRVLNRKTVPNYHPLPGIQDLPDNLRGYSWFLIKSVHTTGVC